MPEHIHVLIEIQTKHSVAQVSGYIKGKNAILISRNYMEYGGISAGRTSLGVQGGRVGLSSLGGF
ncbi:MAG: transposase [Spirochaetaceae bacterium]|jgi:REP element-mobilizing transposase RayT|nr:transposase [Spirochaetaceae bacterium]